MAKNLVIVESPAKARTIEKYLGRNYKVLASVGHVKDLPKNKIGVDVENGFQPEYITIRGKKKVLDELKKEANSAEQVYLAPDPDREGEAIAWHIASELGKKNQAKIRRVCFNEITERGIKDGISKPTEIDNERVMAQQSRRILDRLVGYLVSPLLWKPLKYGLSAGRVQSVALRLICEREEEIEKFKPEEYWTIDGFFHMNGNAEEELKARLEKKDGKKFKIGNEEEATGVLDALKKADFEVSSVKKRRVKQSAPVPFTTSMLQQEASRKLGYSAKKTMMTAQRLYEGLELGKQGPVGLITYMRTDSTRVSEDAVDDARGYISGEYGDKFLGKGNKKGKSKGNVQDAHEAIRPTSVANSPAKVKQYLSNEQFRLYKLIWERFVASQMADAEYDQTTILISDGTYEFKTQAKVLVFAGFRQLYIEGDEEKQKDPDAILFDVAEKTPAKAAKFDPKQNFTQPPPRYTEATIVKTLEAEGIGRPSTYASIISTIQDREYVELSEKRFRPTELGRIVNRLLVSNFPHIFEIKFTAGLEQDLDKIAEGEAEWNQVLEQFFGSFKPELDKAGEKFSVDLKLDSECPKCGGELVIKYGRNGSFAACSKYPDCDFSSDYERQEDGTVKLVDKPKDQPTGIECDKCGKELVIKKTRFGEMLACPGYPECKNIKNFVRLPDGNVKVIGKDEQLKTPCPKCEKGLVVKSGRRGMFIACSGYPDCDFTANMKSDENGDIVPEIIKVDDKVECDKCGSKMALKRGPRGQFFACTAYPKCKSTKPIKTLEDGTITSK
ncbi:type I DNA topoisomerase [Limisalsivibrio acetivorans]|uniref:type I DNA topoisomerase n=1 Tax=Limisalsivibrio acetivorans TaxID=1304888 RepID=UPI0003B3F43C|nr:type I DNA topoisomerase [Limisalsivibrio acetivorans]